VTRSGREGFERALRSEGVSDDEMNAYWNEIDQALSRSAEDVQQGKISQ